MLFNISAFGLSVGFPFISMNPLIIKKKKPQFYNFRTFNQSNITYLMKKFIKIFAH